MGWQWSALLERLKKLDFITIVCHIRDNPSDNYAPKEY